MCHNPRPVPAVVHHQALAKNRETLLVSHVSATTLNFSILAGELFARWCGHKLPQHFVIRRWNKYLHRVVECDVKFWRCLGIQEASPSESIRVKSAEHLIILQSRRRRKNSRKNSTDRTHNKSSCFSSIGCYCSCCF